jgi:hypothetical protein
VKYKTLDFVKKLIAFLSLTQGIFAAGVVEEDLKGHLRWVGTSGLGYNYRSYADHCPSSKYSVSSDPIIPEACKDFYSYACQNRSRKVETHLAKLATTYEAKYSQGIKIFLDKNPSIAKKSKSKIRRYLKKVKKNPSVQSLIVPLSEENSLIDTTASVRIIDESEDIEKLHEGAIFLSQNFSIYPQGLEYTGAIDSMLAYYEPILTKKTKGKGWDLEKRDKSGKRKYRAILIKFLKAAKENLSEREYKMVIKDYIYSLDKDIKGHLENSFGASDIGARFSQSIGNEMYSKEFTNHLNTDLALVKTGLISIFEKRKYFSPEGLKKFQKIKVTSPYLNQGIDIVSDRDKIVEANAHYDPDQNQIQFWGGFSGMNPFSRLIVMAHELGHGLEGPMRRGHGTEDKSAVYSKNSNLRKIQKCLSRSVGITEAQVGEGVCDWIAAEFIAEYFKNSEKSIKQQREIVLNSIVSCKNPLTVLSLENRNDPHPRADLRANRILMANPEIRKIFGCDKLEKVNEPKYCK